jgi:hypothetical protein
VGVACAVLALGSAALVGASYAATLWVQEVLDLTPGRAGLALLPLSAGIVVGAALAPALTRRYGDRTVTVAGLTGAAAGLVLLLPTPVRVPLPALLAALAVVALGFGLQSVPVSAQATAVPRRQGLASAAYQTAGQLGGGLGLVGLAALAAARSAALPGGDRALVAGYHALFAAGAGALLLAALVAAAGFGRAGEGPVPDRDRDAVHADRPGRRAGPLGEQQLGPDLHLLPGGQRDLGRERAPQLGRAGRVPPRAGTDLGVLADRVTAGQLGPQGVADDDGDPVADVVADDLPARRVRHPVPVRDGRRALDLDRPALVPHGHRQAQPQVPYGHRAVAARPHPREGAVGDDHP